MLQYAITDRQFFPGDERQREQLLLAQVRQLATSSIRFLQLREKDLSPPDLLGLAILLRSALPPGSRPRLLINGDLSVALGARADGLHLPAAGSTPAVLATTIASARRAFLNAGLPLPTLSVSTHSIEDVHAARIAGADLILFGPVFEKRVHGQLVHPGIGLAALAQAARQAEGTPLLALGGITPENSGSCVAAGAAGVAGIRLFLPPSPPLPPARQVPDLRT